MRRFGSSVLVIFLLLFGTSFSSSIPGLKQTVVTKRDSRVFFVGITYHLGKAEKKVKEKSLQFDDKI